MYRRLLACLAVLVLLTAACSDDSPSLEPDDTTTDDVQSTDDVVDDGETGDAEDLEDTDEEPVPAEDDGDGLGDPDLDVVTTNATVEELVDAANTDGVVTETEMTEILVEAGTPAGQAGCEGAILAELGVTDPTDPDQLQAIAAELTQEQLIALSTCIGAG